MQLLLLLKMKSLLSLMHEDLMLLLSQVWNIDLIRRRCFVHHDGRLRRRRIRWAGTTHHRSRRDMSHHWGGLC